MTTKCKNCGKPKGEHNATTQECPKGTKHRTLGYTTFGPGKFEPKEKRYYRITKQAS